MTDLEQFAVGDVIRHRRGHTVSDIDVQTLALLSMNTAQTHFNRDSLAEYFDGSFRDLPLSAPVALALVIGLSSEDMSRGALEEVGCTEVRTRAPLFAGDSISVHSEVLAIEHDRDTSGVLTYRATAECAGRVVLTAVRSVRLPSSPVTPADSEELARAFDRLLERSPSKNREVLP